MPFTQKLHKRFVLQIILSVPHFVNRPPQRVFVTSFNVGFPSAAPSTSLKIWNKCTFFILVDLKMTWRWYRATLQQFLCFLGQDSGWGCKWRYQSPVFKDVVKFIKLFALSYESHIDENTEDYVVDKASSTEVNLVDIQTPSNLE